MQNSEPYYYEVMESHIRIWRRAISNLPDLFICDLPTELEKMAKFFCECANQCYAINPTNMQAVAENIGSMHKAIRDALDKQNNLN